MPHRGSSFPYAAAGCGTRTAEYLPSSEEQLPVSPALMDPHLQPFYAVRAVFLPCGRFSRHAPMAAFPVRRQKPMPLRLFRFQMQVRHARPYSAFSPASAGAAPKTHFIIGFYRRLSAAASPQKDIQISLPKPARISPLRPGSPGLFFGEAAFRSRALRRTRCGANSPYLSYGTFL